MTQVIRVFVFFESVTFIVASLIHFGVLIDGYKHQKAGIAESVIGIVLLVGLVWTWVRTESTLAVGRIVQAFALFGTLVGIFTIIVGVGPRTAPDIAYHIGIVIVLVWGLVAAARAKSDQSTTKRVIFSRPAVLDGSPRGCGRGGGI